jgi:hypothetical protein
LTVAAILFIEVAVIALFVIGCARLIVFSIDLKNTVPATRALAYILLVAPLIVASKHAIEP